MRGKKYLLEKQNHGGQIPYSKGRAQNEPSKTYDKIAQETGVSRETVKRDAQLAQAVEDLKEIPKEVLKQNPWRPKASGQNDQDPTVSF